MDEETVVSELKDLAARLTAFFGSRYASPNTHIDAIVLLTRAAEIIEEKNQKR